MRNNVRNMRNNVRNMRNSSVLTALFPQVRQGVLAATLGSQISGGIFRNSPAVWARARQAFSGSYRLWWRAEY